jgi:5'-nucleotidase (lipoprotein e(P4) family)
MSRLNTARIMTLLVFSGFGFAGCVTSLPTSTSSPVAQPSASTLPDSIHWFRDSAEQKATYLETYLAATSSARTLSAGLPPGSWGVILDIDETILDNSDYQKQQALAGLGFTRESWNTWVLQRKAGLLPGAKTFIDAVRDELQGKVVLVTNRSHDQCGATEDNLHGVAVKYDQILCDDVGNGDKNPRFQKVIHGVTGVTSPLNVLIWVGDNIQDFPGLTQQAPGDFSPFGKNYFALPDPMYGSWQRVPER